jgi:hypothetical protein
MFGFWIQHTHDDPCDAPLNEAFCARYLRMITSGGRLQCRVNGRAHELCVLELFFERCELSVIARAELAAEGCGELHTILAHNDDANFRARLTVFGGALPRLFHSEFHVLAMIVHV